MILQLCAYIVLAHRKIPDSEAAGTVRDRCNGNRIRESRSWTSARRIASHLDKFRIHGRSPVDGLQYLLRTETCSR